LQHYLFDRIAPTARLKYPIIRRGRISVSLTLPISFDNLIF